MCFAFSGLMIESCARVSSFSPVLMIFVARLSNRFHAVHPACLDSRCVDWMYGDCGDAEGK